eukprot:74842_1
MNEASVHYFFGYDSCHSILWYSFLILFIFIILSFVIIFLYLFRMNGNKRYDQNANNLYPFIQSYKAHVYYWECIIVIRRMLIILVCTNINDNNLKILVLSSVILASIFAHFEVNPFIYDQTNQFEIISLLFLELFILSIYLEINNNVLINMLIVLLILLPVILLNIYGIGVCKNNRKESESRNLVGRSSISMSSYGALIK